MSNFAARTADTLGDAAAIVKRVAELLMYVAAVVALVCVIGLVVAGFYGIVHKGNDFGSFGGGGGRGEGDVIVLPHLLS